MRLGVVLFDVPRDLAASNLAACLRILPYKFVPRNLADV